LTSEGLDEGLLSFSSGFSSQVYEPLTPYTLDHTAHQQADHKNNWLQTLNFNDYDVLEHTIQSNFATANIQGQGGSGCITADQETTSYTTFHSVVGENVNAGPSFDAESIRRSQDEPDSGKK